MLAMLSFPVSPTSRCKRLCLIMNVKAKSWCQIFCYPEPIFLSLCLCFQPTQFSLCFLQSSLLSHWCLNQVCCSSGDSSQAYRSTSVSVQVYFDAQVIYGASTQVSCHPVFSVLSRCSRPSASPSIPHHNPDPVVCSLSVPYFANCSVAPLCSLFCSWSLIISQTDQQHPYIFDWGTSNRRPMVSVIIIWL